jgi:NADPH:quinone reductase
MQAIQVGRFGGPEVLVPVEVPDLIAGRGQAIIDVAVADVLFLDALIRYGLAADFFPLRPPYVPGTGVAGTVISLGPDTDASWIGRRVVANTGAHDGSGGYAQQAAKALAAAAEGLIRPIIGQTSRWERPPTRIEQSRRAPSSARHCW